MGKEQAYNDSHIKTYNNLLNNVMPLEKNIEFNELYNDARHDALGVMKGKRIKDYNHATELMAEALIKYRKSSKHPHASDKKEDKHFYITEVKNFMEAYARQNHTTVAALEKKFKLADWKELFDAFLENEKGSVLESKIDVEMRQLLKKDRATIKGVAEYHLAQNPEFKKTLAPEDLSRFTSDYEMLLNVLKNYRGQTLTNKLNDYTPKDKPKDPAKK